MITIGIDPHKSSLTAVAVDSTAESVATIKVVVTATTVCQLQQWAQRWPSVAGRWRGLRAWDGVWLRGWRPRVSRSWMCRLSWPLGLGCSIPVMLARPTC